MTRAYFGMEAATVFTFARWRPPTRWHTEFSRILDMYDVRLLAFGPADSIRRLLSLGETGFSHLFASDDEDVR